MDKFIKVDASINSKKLNYMYEEEKKQSFKNEKYKLLWFILLILNFTVHCFIIWYFL